MKSQVLSRTGIAARRQFQGRSRPFPPEAVLGPAFMPGLGGNLACLTDTARRQPRSRGSRAAGPQEPGEPG